MDNKSKPGTVDEKGTIVSFALVAVLFISSILVVASISILFLREISIKEKLNQILRTAEGKVGLWAVTPATADYQAALNALIHETEGGNVPGGSGAGGVIEATLLNYGSGTKAWFAFLPPGECARLADGKLVCNSHMCSLPPTPSDPGDGAPMCYACKGGMTSLFRCGSIPAGYSSCSPSASSFCAQPSSSDSFLAKVEEFPTEIVAVVKTTLFGGFLNVERKVIVQGYPRVLNQEIVAAAVPPPVCGVWTESTSCPVPPQCGDVTQTYPVPRNWSCSTPALGCRLLSDPSGPCGPNPGGSISCPYVPCECVYLLSNSGEERDYASMGIEGGHGTPQCMLDFLVNNRKCQWVNTNDRLEKCTRDTDFFGNPLNSCTWTTYWGVGNTPGWQGYFSGLGHGQQGVLWLNHCTSESNFWNDPARRGCYFQCRQTSGLDADPWSEPLYYAWDNCRRNTCGFRALNVNDLANFLGVPPPLGLPGYCYDDIITDLHGESANRPNSATGPGFFSTESCQTRWFMDENCNVVPDSGRLCGVVHIETTPLSLVWEEKPISATVVNFALNPTVDAPWSVWKASAALPLLVYDPTNSGSITSAMQLFGNYAFGGQEAPLLSGTKSGSEVKVGKSWDNGYSALALLDKDKDGEIKGNELLSLSLWFDGNQDAQSQEGEVIPLRNLDITALYYKGVVAKGNDFSLAVGYERLANGQVVKGASIDWLGAVYATKGDALAALATESKMKSNTSQKSSSAESGSAELSYERVAEKVMTKEAGIAILSQPDITGFWQWVIEDDKGRSAPGLLMLNDNGKLIDGWTVVNAKVADNQGKGRLRETMLAYQVVGERQVRPNGDVEILLTVKDRNAAKSTIVVSPSGNTMQGWTSQQFVDADKTTTVSYNWTGRKL